VWDDASSYDVDWESVETLSQQLTANGGPEASETQLRFLQQLMLEANCVDYSVMLCLLLRDPVGVTRAVNQHSLGSLPEDTLLRLKRGIRALLQWADANCFGYIPLMQAFLNHFISLGPAESESSTATSGPSTPRTESRATLVDQQTANAQDSSTPGQAAANRKSPYAHPQLTIDPDVEVELVSGSSPNQQREGCWIM